MRRGLVAVLVSLLLLPGSVFAFQFNAPPALSNFFAEIGTFIDNLFAPPAAAHHTEPAAAAAAEPTGRHAVKHATRDCFDQPV